MCHDVDDGISVQFPWAKEIQLAQAELASKKYVKKPLPAPLIHKTIEFAECVACVCPGIIILHCSKTDVEEIKATLDNA